MCMRAFSIIDVLGASDERDVCHRQATYRRRFNICSVLLPREKNRKQLYHLNNDGKHKHVHIVNDIVYK